MRIIRCSILSCLFLLFMVATLECQWVQVKEYTGNVMCFLSYSKGPAYPYLFAGTTGGGIFRSTDNGASWSVMGLIDTTVLSFAASPNGGEIFAGTNGQGVYRAGADGGSWAACNNGLTTKARKTVRALAIGPNELGINVFAGTDDGIFLFASYGESWTSKDLMYVNALALREYGSGGIILYAAITGGVYASTNNGTTWTEKSMGLPYTDVTTLDVSNPGSLDENIFAGVHLHYIFRSTNGGVNWTNITNNNGLTASWVWALAVCPDAPENIFAGGDGGVFLSTDNGTNWSAVNNDVLKGSSVMSLVVTDDGAGGKYLFAGTMNNGIWRRSVSDMITSVHGPKEDIPKQFRLLQNYPNPFNPSTTVTYTLPVESRFSLKIYNVLGQVVTTLWDGEQQAGDQSITWDAGSMSSGLYYYRLEAASVADPGRTFTSVKKMVHVK
jgi:photosystem II stability/assembly factor-like uncharacterized protein